MTFHGGDRVAVEVQGGPGFTGVVVAVLDDTAIVECDGCTPTQAHEVPLSAMSVRRHAHRPGHCTIQFFDPTSPTGWPREWTPNLVAADGGFLDLAGLPDGTVLRAGGEPAPLIVEKFDGAWYATGMDHEVTPERIERPWLVLWRPS